MAKIKRKQNTPMYATKADLVALRKETRAGFNRIDARFTGFDQRFDGIDRRLGNMDKRFDGIDKKIDSVDSRLSEQIARNSENIIEILRIVKKFDVTLEERHREQMLHNKIVQQELSHLSQRLDRVEQR